MGLKWLARVVLLYLLTCAILATSSALFTIDCDSLRKRDARDVAVVLSGGLRGVRNWDTEPVSRPAAGAALFRLGIVSRLHLSGWSEVTTAPSMMDEVLTAGVPPNLVTVEDDAHSTLQNALFSLPYLPEDASLMIVTDAYHMLRARASFAWAGRPAAGCAAAQPPQRTKVKLHVMIRETAAWAINVPRAIMWSAARLVGLDKYLPQGFLA
jgi:uncharacterized SAM-binding protein YcdF (DUF218 family)